MTNDTPSTRLQQLMQAIGLNQGELADELEVYACYVSAMMAGRRKAGIRMCRRIMKVAEKHGVKVDESFLRPDLSP